MFNRTPKWLFLCSNRLVCVWESLFPLWCHLHLPPCFLLVFCSLLYFKTPTQEISTAVCEVSGTRYCAFFTYYYYYAWEFISRVYARCHPATFSSYFCRVRFFPLFFLSQLFFCTFSQLKMCNFVFTTQTTRPTRLVSLLTSICIRMLLCVVVVVCCAHFLSGKRINVVVKNLKHLSSALA